MITSKGNLGISLVIQWLRLGAPKAGSPSSILGWRTRSHMPQLRVHMPQMKVPHAATKRTQMLQMKMEEPVCHN